MIVRGDDDALDDDGKTKMGSSGDASRVDDEDDGGSTKVGDEDEGCEIDGGESSLQTIIFLAVNVIARGDDADGDDDNVNDDDDADDDGNDFG